jgi:hypothetical protein
MFHFPLPFICVSCVSWSFPPSVLSSVSSSIRIVVRAPARRKDEPDATVVSGSVVNKAKSAYNGFSQFVAYYQAHSKAVTLSTSPKLQYAFPVRSANTSRPQTMAYLNARVPAYDGDTGYAGFRDGALPAKGAMAHHKRDTCATANLQLPQFQGNYL